MRGLTGWLIIVLGFGAALAPNTTLAVSAVTCEQVFAGDFETLPPASGLLANPGADQAMMPGAAVELDGGGSSSEPGSSLNYCWQMLSRPANSVATIENPQTVTPTLLTDVSGDYRVRLVVDDGTRVSRGATATLSSRQIARSIGVAGGQVVSPDRAVRLDIPAGALNEDTLITIRLLTAQEQPADLAAAGPLAIYDFSPDGLQFNSPVSFTARLNSRLPGVPAGTMQPATLLSMDANQTEELQDVTNTMDSDEQWVSGQLDHFSLVGIFEYNFVRVQFAPLLFGLEGNTFTGTYTATASGAGTTTVTTDRTPPYGAAPLETAPDLSNPLLDNLAFDTDINLVHAANTPPTSATGSFSGRCLRAGVGEVSLRLALDGAVFASLPNMLVRGNRVSLVYRTSCFAPLILNLPVARDDLATPPRAGNSTTIGVLANDTTTGIDLGSIRIDQPPAAGNTTVNANGTISYTAAPDFFLVDSFDYSFANGGGLRSNVATVFITPLSAPNQSPAASDDAATTLVDTPIDIAILANDSDTDGSLDAASVILDTSASSGTVTVQVDGSVTYQPAAGVSGTDTFTYTVADDNGARSASANVVVTVNVPGGPPMAVNDQILVLRNTSQDLDVLANDTGSFDPVSLSISQGPNFGSATVVLGESSSQKGIQSGPGSATARIRYTPNADYIGDDFLVYSITNTAGTITRSANARIVVAPENNQPPVAVDDVVNTLPNTPLTIFVLINDFDTDSLIDAGSEQAIDLPVNGTLADGGFGAFLYTPNAGFVGTDTFTYDFHDAFLARSNEALVTITVAPPANVAPTAGNDDFTLGVNSAPLALNVVTNDLDTDGNLDLSSIVITRTPETGGTATVTGNGRITIAPDPGFVGSFDFRYTISDGIDVSNEATVSVLVRQFVGTDIDPTDNISAANTIFVSFFGDGYIDQGTGATVGVSHNNDFPASLSQIDDYTVYFDTGQAVINSDTAVDPTIDFSTTSQDFTAQYDEATGRWAFPDLQNDRVFSDFGPDQLTVTGTSAGMFSIEAPAPIRQPDGQLKDLLGDFAGLNTEIRIPIDAGASHFLVRILGFSADNPGTLTGVTLRIPIDEIPAQPDGTRVRPLLTSAAQTLLNALKFRAQFSVLVVLYNQQNNTAFFTHPGARPVPLAAGRGFIFPGSQINPAPALCDNVVKFSLCAGGPNPRILATNANGTIDLFDTADGQFVANFVGESIPNFLVNSGWQAIQDPRTNCILVSDGGNSAGGGVHQYDTDGVALTGNLVQVPISGGVRGMTIRNGNLLAAIHTAGEVREYDTVTGQLLGTPITDLDRPNALYTDAAGNLFVSDQGASGFNDAVYFYPANGDPRSTVIGPGDLAGGLATPYQISRLQNGNLGLAHFGGASIRVFNQGFANVANLLLEPGPGGDPYQVRGLWPLANGSFLVTANNGGGVSVFDPFNVSGGGVTVLRQGSTFRFLGLACMP